MPGRGPQTFKKRQKEQQRKEKQEAKIARRHGHLERPGSGQSNYPAGDEQPIPAEQSGEPTAETENTVTDPGV